MQIKNKNLNTVKVLTANNKINLLEAITFMEKRVDDIIYHNQEEMIWFLEHNSVYTAGRGQISKKKKINNIPIYNIGRGGKLTWHGPGQRIIYFMIDLKKRNFDIRSFVNNLEQAIIETLKELDIVAYRKLNLIGIWTKNKNGFDAKIASLGLRVRKGIVYHGLSINVNCDLSNFNYINPCGISNAKVTSVNELLKKINISDLDSVIKKKLIKCI